MRSEAQPASIAIRVSQGKTTIVSEPETTSLTQSASMKICTNEVEEHIESTLRYRQEINEESQGLFFFFLTFLLIIWFKKKNKFR